MTRKHIAYTQSSGNIYEDIGFTDSEERLAKAQLAVVIETLIQKKGLTQVEAALLLGVTQPKISALVNGQLAGFSMERLIHFLICLNHDVEITVKPRATQRTLQSGGHLNVAYG